MGKTILSKEIPEDEVLDILESYPDAEADFVLAMMDVINEHLGESDNDVEFYKGRATMAVGMFGLHPSTVDACAEVLTKYS